MLKMKIVEMIADLRLLVDEAKATNKQVGFVPTMGALHAGHIELVKRTIAENDLCVVSVFVNPTQFNDKNDLVNYPRTLAQDSELLQQVGCHILFAPTVEEIYPQEDTRVFDLGAVSEVMEGEFRPGHFNGVAQVVSRLFDAVQPHRAYFGEKDFQQIAVIRSMAKILNSPVEIIDCPIVREADGLAMSSRNRRLTPNQRKNAPIIAATLAKSIIFAAQNSVQDTIRYVVDTLNEVEEMEVEYYQIVDANTLQPINAWSDTARAVGCIALFCGEVRLIDNITYVL